MAKRKTLATKVEEIEEQVEDIEVRVEKIEASGVEVEEVVARPLPPNQQAAYDRWWGKKEQK